MRSMAMRLRATALLSLLLASATTVHAAGTTSVLFAGLADDSVGIPVNDGALATVDQTTGVLTIVGHPAGVAQISGLAFDNSGALFASTQPPDGVIGGSLLLQLNPANGSILASVPITDSSNNNLNIGDLAVQPSTGALYGVESPDDNLNGQGKVWVINKSTGVATLVGNTGHFFAAIAFAPNGTFYMTAADKAPSGIPINIQLLTLNPANAAVLTSVPLAQEIEALAVRPEDGVIFGGNGDAAQLFTIDPATGNLTLIGFTGTTYIGDLAFQSSLTVGPGQCTVLPFSLPAPAGPSGEIVTFTSSDPTKIMINLGSSTSLFVPPGEVTGRRAPSVCGVNFGSATITITAGGQTVTESVQVTAALSFYPATLTIVRGTQGRPTLILSAPAPANLTINLSSDNPNVAAVPATVTIPTGFSSATVPVLPISTGTTDIHASSANLASGILPIRVQ